jgi:hypothetical protein
MILGLKICDAQLSWSFNLFFQGILKKNYAAKKTARGSEIPTLQEA